MGSGWCFRALDIALVIGEVAVGNFTDWNHLIIKFIKSLKYYVYKKKSV